MTQSEVTEISPIEVSVKVEIPWDRVKEGLESSYKRLSQTARVKGFRPGKVPRRVLRQLFGRQVKGEVTADLVEKGLLEAVTKHELRVVSRPELEAPEVEDGKPLAFVATMQVQPRIEEVDLTRLEIIKPDTDVPNAAIDEEVEKLRAEQAELRVPEPPRPAASGDEVTITYTVALDGEEKDEMKAEGRKVVLGADLTEEFEKGLTGASTGDQREISLSFASDDGRQELAGKTAVFSVTVDEVRERILPTLDDEFAKDVGDFQTLLELRLDIRKRLETEAERRADSELKDRLLDKLIETNEIPVPPAMIEEQKVAMAQQLGRLAQMNESSMEFAKQLAGRIEQQAERMVRGTILKAAVARSAGLEVTPGEIDQELAQIAERTGKHIAKVRAEIAGEDRAYLVEHLLERKITEHLKAQAKFVEGEQAAEEAADRAGEEPESAKGE